MSKGQVRRCDPLDLIASRDLQRTQSKDNYVGLTASPDDVYGQLMSITDHLTESYLQLLTEWTDDEIRVITKRLVEGNRAPDGGQAHPCRRGGGRPRWPRRSCRRPHGVHRALLEASFGDTQNLPVLSLKDHAGETLGSLVSRTLDFAPSISAVRRVAEQKGLRLIRESDGDQQATPLTEPSAQQTFGAVVSEAGALEGAELYLKVGRKVARIDL